MSKANFTGVNSITSMAQKIGEDKNYLLTNALLFNFKGVFGWNLIMTQNEGNMSRS